MEKSAREMMEEVYEKLYELTKVCAPDVVVEIAKIMNEIYDRVR